MIKRIAALAMLLALPAAFFAQEADAATRDGGEPVFKRNVPVAVAGIVIPSLVIGGYNRFVTRSDWAQVTWDDAAHFYEHKLSWDTDWYWTNFVLHPYQGGLSYMSARAANFSPYESVLWAAASSLIWEYFFETNSPSKNDLVYTSIGAFPVGEMLFRLSYALQQAWSPLRFLASPTRLYTDPFMRGQTNAPKGRVESFTLVAAVGTEYGRSKAQTYSPTTEFYPGHAGFELDVVYGDPYGHDSNTPYSQFELALGGKLGAGSGKGYKALEEKLMYDIHLSSNGMLFARSVDWGSGTDTTVGMVLDYDFFWQSFYDISSLAPGFAIKQRAALPAGRIEWQWHLGAMLLGTTDLYYYRRHILENASDYRSYSYTVGAEMVALFKWVTGAGHTLGADLRSYLMYDFYDQLMGEASAGVELMALCTLRYEVPLSPTVSIGLANDVYCKGAFYRSLPDMFAAMYAGELYARIALY